MEAAFPFDDNFGFDDILLAAIFWTESQKRRHNIEPRQKYYKKRSYSCYRKTIILLCLWYVFLYQNVFFDKYLKKSQLHLAILLAKIPNKNASQKAKIMVH